MRKTKVKLRGMPPHSPPLRPGQDDRSGSACTAPANDPCCQARAHNPLRATAVAIRHDRPWVDSDDPNAIAHAFAADALREHHQGCIAATGRDVLRLRPAPPAMPMMFTMTPLLRCRHARQDVAREVDVAENLQIPAVGARPPVSPRDSDPRGTAPALLTRTSQSPCHRPPAP